jgi:hypothetical protein
MTAFMMWPADYSEDEWREIASATPLNHLGVNEITNLHRYRIWTHYQRSLHAWLLDHDDTAHAEDMLATKRSCAMYLWYSLLWSLIEGMEKYKIPWIGAMGDDVNYLADRLRRCRNAVFHVPRDGQWDKRLFEIMFDGPVGDVNSGPDEESVRRVGRLTSGIGRLFLEEYGRRDRVRPDSIGLPEPKTE